VGYALSDEMKIIDLGLPQRSLKTSTVGYPSNSWASCYYFFYFLYDFFQLDIQSMASLFLVSEAVSSCQ